MSTTASSSSNVSADPAGKPQQLPFLLSSQQGKAARALLSYVASLGLPGPDAQLVAVVVAIRAARGGVGNLTGTDLSALRLGDARGAVDALRALGWQVDDALFDGEDPATPVPVTVPDLAREADHPLPFGKNVRSRVSGWTTRALSAKPVKKLPPAARLAGLFLAAHSTAKLQGQIPPDLPEACRAALPDLRRRGFLAELSEDRCRLDPAVRHLSGMRRPDEEEQAAEPAKAEGKGGLPARPEVRFDAAAWAEWKRAATPALRRHVEAVEFCAVYALEPGQVASAFMERVRPQFFSKWIKNAYASGRRHTLTAAHRQPSSLWPSGPSTATVPPTISCAQAWAGTCAAQCAASSCGVCCRTSGWRIRALCRGRCARGRPLKPRASLCPGREAQQ